MAFSVRAPVTPLAGKAVAPQRRAAVVVRAEADAAAAEPAWTVPTLDPDTPSPIFGGSTGGLLSKAQVRSASPAACFDAFYEGVSIWDHLLRAGQMFGSQGQRSQLQDRESHEFLGSCPESKFQST